jgi:hypothetical protein
VDATVTGTSKILIGWGSVLDTDTNEPEMDDLSFSARPAAGSFTLIVAAGASRQLVGGPVKLNYMVAA